MIEDAWEAQKRCPLCHGNPKFQVRQIADYFYGVPGRWDIMRCGRCGHCFLSHVLPWQRVPELYAEYFTHRAAAPFSGVGTLEKIAAMSWLRRCPGHRALANDIWRHVGGLPPGRLLELGCGNGAYLAWMARHGWEVCGQDIDLGAVKAAQARIGAAGTVFCGEMIQLPWPEGSFDVVNSCNVIEHMPEPQRMMRTAFQMLKPGGRLVIQTVNNQARSARCFGRYWPGWDAPRHFHVFNADGLSRLAVETGLVVERVDCRPAMIVAGVGRQALEWESHDRGRPVNRWHSRWRSCRGRARWALECLGVLRPSEALILIARKA